MTLNKSALSVIRDAGYVHHGHESIIKKRFAMLPRNFRSVVNARYISTFEKHGYRDANLMLLDVVESAGGLNGLLASNDAELCAYAKKCAGEAYTVASRFLIADMSLAYVCEYAESKGIEPPNEKISMQGRFARLMCPKWWRRAIRKSIARRVERFAIDLGLVCKQKGIYASDETVQRRQEQKRRNSALLKTIIAVNELGQEFTLEELSALNVSNPKLRRMELMTRIAGFDEIAIAAGHAADFYTLTCPSKYHAVGYDGKTNPKYGGFTPKQSQEFLTKTWARVRAYLAKRGVRVYGVRVAEPHHDGTPHWHMILFCEPRFNDFVRQVITNYFLGIRNPFLKHDGVGGFNVQKGTGVCWLDYEGGEIGANKYRVKVEAIDRAKGSAVGYLSKYISKNIDAHGIGDDEDFEGGHVADNVQRVDAWAACWGIRQFQQIGGAPVGVWREVRRLLDASEGVLLESVYQACDAGDWAKYTRLQGGVFVSRRDLGVRVYREFFNDAVSLYDGVGLERVVGVYSVVDNLYKATRLHDWVLKRGDLSPSWSSVNNCNQNLLIEEVKGVVLEKITHFVHSKPPVVFDVAAGTGIKNDEKISDFDKRSFCHG